jgi:transposase
MNHRTGLDQSQTLLFPERLEDYIGQDNPARFLDAFVEGLDLHAPGFAKAQVATTGRPPYDPADLLKPICTVLCIGFAPRGCWRRKATGTWR